MTRLASRAALEAPGDDASMSQLQELITAGEGSGDSLVSKSEDFLRAFCDSTLSHTRRRWIGLALARMLNASPEVAQHLDAVEQQLQGLGEIILSPTEREDTKIVAGLVVRQALQHHIDFAKFWASDKVRNSAPNFPVASTAAWLQNFQSFLDTLGDLALANSPTDPVILYAVSVSASDSFRWASSEKRVLTAIMQQDRLTLVLPDAKLKDVQFVDVPVSRIGSVQAQASGPLPDSQSRSTKHEPWDLVLRLKDEPWTYLLNTSKRQAKELTILFERSEDATECEIAIRELKEAENGGSNRRQTRSMGSSSSPVDSNPLSGRAMEGGRQARQPDEPLQSDRVQCNSNVEKRKTYSGYAMRHRPSSPVNRAGHSSSDELGKSPSGRATEPSKSSQQAAVSSHSEREDRVHSSVKKHRTPLAPKQDDVSATQRAAEDIKLASKQGKSQDKTKQKSDLIKKQTSRTRAVSNGVKPELARLRTQKPVDQADASKYPSSPTASTHSASESLKQPNGNGKLPKVSHARKQKPSQQMRVEPDVFEIPSEDHKKPVARKQGTTDKISSSASRVRADTEKGGLMSKALEEETRRPKLRTKRRAEDEDDDDFVPTAKPTKRTAKKRKIVAEAINENIKPKKKAKAEHKASATSHPSRSKRNLSRDPGSDVLARVMDSQHTSPEDQKVTDVPTVTSRASLIGGLLSSQHRVAGNKTAFKKPALPSRIMQPPSTPTQRPTVPVKGAEFPHTGDSQRTPRAYDALMSSPPSNGFGFGDEDEDPQDDEREAEILSSNRKPLPASPHAESTAITGHADRDDVDLEKKRCEVQTAQSDPFRHKQDSPSATPFIRRLTGDKPVPTKPGLIKSVSSPNVFRVDGLMNLKPAKPAVKIGSQPLPQALSLHERDSLPLAKKATALQRDHVNDISADHFEIFLDSQARKADASHPPQAHATVSETPQVAKHKSALPEQGKAASGKENVARFASRPTDYEVGSHHDPNEATHIHEGSGADGDLTLVNDESEEALPPYDGTPQLFRSSPPGSPSDRSSTSAEPESSPPRSPPTSEFEEMEWEATLQPHQRALHDQLMRVSKRVLRHVVDNEAAVTDIADVYASDGEHLLKTMLERQDGEYKELWDDMEGKKVTLKKELEKSARALSKERQRVRTLT